MMDNGWQRNRTLDALKHKKEIRYTTLSINIPVEILSLSQLVWYVGVKKEMYTTRNQQYFVHKLQCILHTYYAKLQMLLQKSYRLYYK